MKLPEYDNRPGPGEPLFDDSKESGWDDIKFPALLIGLPVLVCLLFGSAIMDIVSALKAFFH